MMAGDGFDEAGAEAVKPAGREALEEPGDLAA
jgi:hypothetical protein